MSNENQHDPFCERCWGSGTRDTGGFQPWGEPILEDCDCHIDFAKKKLIDRQKDHFSMQITSQAMKRVLAIAPMHQVRVEQLISEINPLILDAIEFGIHLGGMDWKEGE